MAPPSILYTYALTPNAIRAITTPNTPIVIMSNNVTFLNEIPKKFQDKEIEAFVSYLAACSIRYALVGFIDPFR